MEKVHDFRYRVHSGEEITIKVTPMNLGPSLPSVEAERDGKAMKNVGTDDAPVYKFTADKPVKETHLVIVEVTFQDDSNDNALYRLAISGKNDVGCPCGFDIAKTDEDLSPDINFRVKS